MSAVVVLWSFHGSAASEHVEQQAARTAGALLFEACVAAASVIVPLVLGYGEPKPTLRAYSGDVNGGFQRDVDSRSGDVNKVGAQRRWKLQ